MLKIQLQSRYVSYGIYFVLAGIGAGVLNSVVGSGGGIILIVVLSALGINYKRVHATVLCVTVALSIISSFMYIANGYVATELLIPVLIPAFIGGLIGGFLMHKLSGEWLKLLFGVIMIAGGVISIVRG